MRRNALTVAQACLAFASLAVAALLFLPSPQSSSAFVAARKDTQAAALKSEGPADATVASRHEFDSALRDSTRVRAVSPPDGRLAASERAQTPLAGFDGQDEAVPSASPAIALRIAEDEPAGPLVPEPTPDPAPLPRDDLAGEVRALRDEVLRLAQSKAATATAAPSDLSGEVRRLLEELRSSERFRQLEDEVRRLQGGMSASSPTAESNAAPPGRTVSVAPIGRDAIVKAIPSEAGGDRFTLQVESAEITQVLDMLGQMAGWNVAASPGVKGAVTLNLRDVTLDEALTAVLDPRDLVAERKDNLLFVYPRTDIAKRNADARVLVTKVYRPSYVGVKDLQTLVTPLLTETIGKISVTSASEVGLELDNTRGGGDTLTQRDALVVQDYPDVIELVDEIVADMDVPPQQVVIEAYVLRVRLSDEMRFGVNFAILNGSGRQLVTSGSGFDIATSTGFPGEREALIPALPQFLSAVPGLRYGFLTGDVTGFIKALEGISETSLVASPSLRVLNKQKAELIIGQRLGYKTQTFNNQQTIENVQFLDVGTKLILRPFVAPDGLVRMEIHPERSSGEIDEKGLPVVDTTEVTTNVMVRDGTTVVIGGLIDEQTEEDVNQVPILGSIPVLGYAFRNTTERLIRNELIVLITPRIVCDPVEEARGDVLRYESERRADHFADKLSPVSRRNLARLHTDRAAELYEQGRFVEAHDHARHALSIRTNDAEALELKERSEESFKNKARRFFWLPTEPETDAPIVTPGSVVLPPLTEVPPPPAPPATSLQDFGSEPQGPRVVPPAPAPAVIDDRTN